MPMCFSRERGRGYVEGAYRYHSGMADPVLTVEVVEGFVGVLIAPIFPNGEWSMFIGSAGLADIGEADFIFVT